jgi:hypothetical protein
MEAQHRSMVKQEMAVEEEEIKTNKEFQEDLEAEAVKENLTQVAEVNLVLEIQAVKLEMLGVGQAAEAAKMVPAVAHPKLEAHHYHHQLMDNQKTFLAVEAEQVQDRQDHKQQVTLEQAEVEQDQLLHQDL